MKLHIQRSFFQAYLWFHAPFEEVVDVNPVEYGYAVDEEDHLFPVVTYGKNVPVRCHVTVLNVLEIVFVPAEFWRLLVAIFASVVLAVTVKTQITFKHLDTCYVINPGNSQRECMDRTVLSIITR